MFFLFDSLTKTQKPSPKHTDISFYACGITPYSDAHIGHGRSYVVFDGMRRVMEAMGKNVRFVRNITDVDDKIILEAQKRNISWHELSDFYSKDNARLMTQLGCQTPFEPKASMHLDGIVQMVGQLLKKGHAYVANGDVLFSSKTGGIGFGAGRTAGTSRVSHEHKEHAEDFVLWKAAKPGEPAWDSPWGEGRPGWHIECSAMIKALLGETIDYHGGGSDLRFPHHHAECLQSEGAHDAPLARHWLHHGVVRDHLGQKMSKSLGNVVLLKDALIGAEELAGNAAGSVVRWALLSTLWTKPLDWGPQSLIQARDDLLAWQEIAQKAPQGSAKDLGPLLENFNTPKLRAHLHLLAKHPEKDTGQGAFLLNTLGVDLKAVANMRHQATVNDDLEQLITQRQKMREEGRFTEADLLRDEIARKGGDVKDPSIKARF